MTNILQKNTIIALSLALITALFFAFIIGSPVLAQYQLKTELANNCANTTIVAGTERNTVLDPENGVVSVELVNGGNISKFLLPYEPQIDFQGCSQDAKELLVHVQQAHEEYIADMCGAFKAIVSGEKPLPVKGGETANMQGAVDFVEQYCK